MDPLIRHSYVQVNNSIVHLVQYCSKENDFLKFKSSQTSPSKIVVFVPGNPGVLGIYHDFLVNLFKSFNSSSTPKDSKENVNYTILAIGHNNFDHPDHVQYKTAERTIIEENELNFVEKTLADYHTNEPHHIELQVLNKIIILKRLVDLEDVKVAFVGHSIGCYVILRILQDSPICQAHEGSVLIHPALENLATTRKGSECVQLFNYKLDYLLMLVAYVIDLLFPKQAKLMIAKWYCTSELVNQSSNVVLESITQIVSPKTLRALFEMAKSELQLVKNLNPETMIKPQSSRLKLIYAIDDHWVNTDNRQVLLETNPDLHIEEQPKMHAFVMDPPTVMDYSVKVAMYIRDFFET